MNKVYLMGDIHGQTAPVENFWRRLDQKVDSSDTLILLGDVGANYYLNGRDAKFKKKLGKFGFTYFCIRGNHEDRPENCAAAHPNEWHQEEFFGNTVWVEDKFPFIKYALDQVAVYNIDNYSTLVVPGAYSIDKYYRIEKGWTWFEGEQLTDNEKQAGIKIILKSKFDYVLSHTCPANWTPYIQDLFINKNQLKIDKSMERYLQYIDSNITYKRWYFGHYHDNRDLGVVSATMMFHEPLPFGSSYLREVEKQFLREYQQ